MCTGTAQMCGGTIHDVRWHNTCCVLAQNLLLLSKVIPFDSINPIECLHVALGSASVSLLESNAAGFKVAAFNALMFILFLFTDVAANYSDEPIFASSGVFSFQAVGFAALLYCFQVTVTNYQRAKV